MNFISKIITAIINALQGRTTTFLAGFFICGNILHWFHRLDATYITFLTVLMGYVLGHSIKDDLLTPPETPKV